MIDFHPAFGQTNQSLSRGCDEMTRSRLPAVILVLALLVTLNGAVRAQAPRLMIDTELASRPEGPEPADAAQQADPVTVVESIASQLVVKVSLPEMYIHETQMADGNTYHVGTVEGSGLSDAGKPAMPYFGRWILIPNGTVAELVVDPGLTEVVAGIRLQPAQLPLLNLEDAPPPPFTKDEEIYATDADYPGVFARLEPVKIMRGQQLTILRLYPYQYNPVQERLSIYPDLTVTVRFIGDLEPISLRLKSESYDKMMRRIAINANAVLSAEEEARYPTNPHVYTGPYGWNYLIFTPPEFATAAHKLAAWKSKMGFKTLVTQIPSNWKASDIKNAIQGAYDTWDVAPEYVLLIGDAEYVPTHYKTLHPYEKMLGGKDTQGYTATDLYYTTLQGNDYIPDIAIGRLSVDTAAQAEERVDGIISYEQNPVTDSSFYNTVTIVAHFQDGIPGLIQPDGIADSRFAQTSEDLALFFSQPQYNINKTVKRIYYAKPNITPTKWNNNQIISLNNFGGGPAGNPGDPIPSHLRKPAFPWDGDAQDITNAVQAGTFLLTHRDHGGRQRWVHPAYDALNVFLLRNHSYLPVVWSVNCQTGWFDNETDFKKKPGIKDRTQNDEESFSEWWERPLFRFLDGDDGAVGIIAATRVTDSIYNDRLMWGWTDAIWPGFIKIGGAPGIGAVFRMGDVLNLGKLYMSSVIPDNEWRKLHFEAYHWFGDPAMEIRTEPPPLIAVIKPDLWPWVLHPRDLLIHVDWEDPYGTGSASPEKATVTISKPGIDDYWVGTTDVNGDVTFPDLVTTDLGTYEVVVTASNSVPYTGTFESLAGPAGGIRMDAELYSCPSTVEVEVADADLMGLGRLEIPLSTESGDVETISLWEMGAETGMFIGTIPAFVALVVPYDGILQVNDGDTIMAGYQDENDGTGSRVWVEDTALIDCQAPMFDGLISTTPDRESVELQWGAASEDNSVVIYNIYRGQTPGGSIGSLIGTTWALSFRDYDAEPGQPYYYVVRAQDAVGNEDSNTTELSARVPIAGDANNDCVVNLTDIQQVAGRWHTSCHAPDPDGNASTPNYEPLSDLNLDCSIDIEDIMEAASHLGGACQ